MLHKYYNLKNAKAVILQDALVGMITSSLIYTMWSLYAVKNIGVAIDSGSTDGQNAITIVNSLRIPDYFAVSRANTLFNDKTQAKAFRCIYAQKGLCTIRT